MTAKIKLYTATAPNGRKVSIALEELSLPYEVIRLDLAAGEQMDEAFLALNPNHKIPVIEDDGQVIWESGAILLHLAEKYGGLLPDNPRGRMEAIQYAFFQTGGIGPNLGRLGGELRKPEGERNAALLEVFSAEVDRLFDVLDRILADGRPYLAREYSIGDIMHFGWLGMALDMKFPLLMKHERIVEWLERIAKRPAVVRGMQVP